MTQPLNFTHVKSRSFLTPVQVCTELQIGMEKVRRMLRSGEIPGIKLGKLWRIPAGKFAEYVKQANMTSSLGTKTP